MYLMEAKPGDSLWYPGLVVIFHPPLLLGVPGHVSHGLQVLGLGLQPLVHEQLRVLGRAEEELPVGLERVDGLHGLMYLGVQGLDLLLGGRGQEEVVHLGLQCVINLEQMLQ